MSTWQIFCDSGNNFRWEISDQQLQIEQQSNAVPRQHIEPPRLPSMADLLFLGCSELLENENGNMESPPVFRTGLGKSVAVKPSSIEKARSILGDVGDGVLTGHLDEGENRCPSLKPVLEMGSLKSATMPSSGGAHDETFSMSNTMFQTGSGKSVNISSSGLHRAKMLLGLDENYDQEPLHGLEQRQKQSTSTELLAWKYPSPLENGELHKLHLSSSTKSSTSFDVDLYRSESKKISDPMRTAPKSSPIKFHTAGGRSISVSSDALQRAKSLLGNLEFGEFESNSADPTFTVIDNGKSSCSSDNTRGFRTPFLDKRIENSCSSSRNFTSPLRSRSNSYQKNVLSRFEKIRPGNNLLHKFDDEATINTSGLPYKSHTSDRKPPKSTSYSAKLDCLENDAVQPKTNPLERSSFNGALTDISNTMKTDNAGNKQYLGEKRRPGRVISVSPFKKLRNSFVAPLNKNSSSVVNDLSRLAPKESHCKQKVSTRYPIQVSRKYLKEFVLQPPLHETLENLPEYVQRMNPVAAECYVFQSEIASNCIGPELLFWMLSQSGASTQYLTKEWVSNHYKWIVWKLASYERCYPAKFSGKLLTVSNVLEELRYRYEREVNHGHRSAIKKILGGDAPPSSTMVLCISSIGEHCDLKFGHQSVPLGESVNDKALKIELTDGWYSMKALLDGLLSQKLASGKLFLGQKLKICGAKLCGWLGPVSPLETSQPSLLLHINGTYRCHWAEKLGFCKSATVPLALRCIKGAGGLVPCTLVGVTRIYPILYWERLSDGSSIVRSEKMEAKALQLYNQRRDAVAEEIVSAIQKEEFDVGKHHESEEGAKIMKLLETAAEPEVLMAGMSSKQLTSFTSYKAKLEALRQSDIQKSIDKAMEAAGLNKREVTQFVRVKVVGLTSKWHPLGGGSPKGLITIWNPTQKQILELSEGLAYTVGGLLPSSSDSGILYLQARGSNCNWLPLSPLTVEKYEQFFTPRSSTTLSSFGEVPMSREFDTAALVVYVGEVYRQGHQQKQWVFVTDGSTSELSWDGLPEALLAINFCLPCTEFDSCAPINSNIAGSVVGFCNLTKRQRDEAHDLWVAEATENSDYFLSYDHAGRKHLKDAAAAVLKWANTSSSIVQKLKDRVLSIIHNSKDGY